jgi:hypothetical protein
MLSIIAILFSSRDHTPPANKFGAGSLKTHSAAFKLPLFEKSYHVPTTFFFFILF